MDFTADYGLITRQLYFTADFGLKTRHKWILPQRAYWTFASYVADSLE